MEDFILGFLENIGSFDFSILVKFIVGSYIFLWVLIALWAWFDSGERTRSILLRVLSVLAVFFGQVLGLILYMVLRSKTTIEESYWGDLERRFLKYETAELGDCPNCGYNLMPGFNHCPSCAYVLKVQCPDCEVMLDKDWKFCPYCSRDMLDVQGDYAKNIQPAKTEVKESANINKREASTAQLSKKERRENVKNFINRLNEKRNNRKAKKDSQEKSSKNETIEDVAEKKEDSSLKVDTKYVSQTTSPVLAKNINSDVPSQKVSRKDTTFLQFMGILGSGILNTLKVPAVNKKGKSVESSHKIAEKKLEVESAQAKTSEKLNEGIELSTENNKQYNNSFNRKKKKNKKKRRNR